MEVDGGPAAPAPLLLVPAAGLGLSEEPGPLGWQVWAKGSRDPLLCESDTSQSILHTVVQNVSLGYSVKGGHVI